MQGGISEDGGLDLINSKTLAFNKMQGSEPEGGFGVLTDQEVAK
jgi:hypothetical protein